MTQDAGVRSSRGAGSATAGSPLAWIDDDAWFAGLILVLVTILAYVVGITGGTFHFDDFHNLTDNENVRSLGNLPRFFTDARTWSAEPDNVMYRPMQVVSYAIDYALWNYRPSGWVLTNTLLHALVAVLTWRLARRLGLSPLASFLAGLVTALHPVHSEVVNYVSSRSESLAALLMLGALHAHLSARGRSGAARVAFAAAAVVVASLSLLAKETTALFFAAVAWMELVADGRTPLPERARRALGWGALYGAAFVAMLALRGAMLGTATADVPLVRSPQGVDHQLGGSISIFDNLLMVQSRVVAIYYEMLALPVRLNVDHDVSRVPEWSAEAVSALVLHAAIVAWALCAAIRGRRIFPLCVGWFWLLLAPSIAFPLNVVMNEHRLYLPGIAVALLAGAALGRVAEILARRRGIVAGAALAAAPLVLFVPLAVQRSREWRDDLTLWSVAVERGGSPRAYMHRGAALVTEAMNENADLLRRGTLLRQALADYHLAEARHPDWYDLHLNLGSAYLHLSRITGDAADLEMSLASFQRAGRIVGVTEFRPLYLQSEALTELGRYAEALAIIRDLDRRDDTVTTLYPEVEARVCRRMGDRRGAFDAMSRVIAIEEPDGRVDGLLTLGWWCVEDGDAAGAERLIGRAIDQVRTGRSREFRPYLYAARMLRVLRVPGAEAQIEQFVRNARALGWTAEPDEARWVAGGATPGALRAGTRGIPTYGPLR